MARALASHWCVSGSNLRRVIVCGFSLLRFSTLVREVFLHLLLKMIEPAIKASPLNTPDTSINTSRILHGGEKIYILSSSGKSKILFLPREHKIHIFELTCDFLFIL